MVYARSQTNSKGYEVLPWGKRRKTTIELTEKQYFFLKEKALELKNQNQNAYLRQVKRGRQASIVSIIRELVKKDWKEWKQRKISKA